MLAMGRALMLRPEILLLDEPSMGLAPKLVEEVFRIIRQLKDEQVTMLLVEQFAMAALGVADHAYVLENGRIRFQGPAAAAAQTIRPCGRPISAARIRCPVPSPREAGRR